MGLIPYGFGAGLGATHDAIRPLLRPDVEHYFSRPQPRRLACGRNRGDVQIVDGVDVSGVVVCGCPRPGTEQLVDHFKGVPIVSLRNGRDPVPTMPEWLPELPWIDVARFTAVNEAPDPAGENLFERLIPHAGWHNMRPYAKGAHALQVAA